ncbi:hypothetical protein CRYUN_Cryun38cG0029900 [Craigia yunnanensis]
MPLAFFTLPNPCIARSKNDCGSSQCGNLTISYPFRLKTQPLDCGDPRLELECENDSNHTTLVINQAKFYVKEILYSDYAIRFVDAILARDNCSLPLSSFPFSFFSCSAIPYMLDPFRFGIMYIVNCTTPMESWFYVDASRCSNSSSHQSTYFYFLDEDTPPRDFNQSCTVVANVPSMLGTISGLSTLDIYEKLLMGFELSWQYYNTSCGDQKFSL